MAMTRLKTGLLAMLFVACGVVNALDAQRIQDIARVEGVRNRQLKGVGLVIGLNGTGDNSRSELTRQLYHAALKNLDIEIPAEVIKSKNIAVVMVTASVSSWMKPGAEFDVMVSSVGDAKSLKGGTLLEARLFKTGASSQGEEEAETFALAQGKVTSDEENENGATCKATVEDDLSFPLHDGRAEQFRVLLNRPDFSTASAIARAVNEFPWLRRVAKNEMPLAHADALGSVRVNVPKQFRTDKTFVEFVSRIMTDVRIDDYDAKVIIDERGPEPMIVVNGRVRVKPVVVLYKGLEIKIGIGAGGTRDSSYPSAGHPLLIDVLEELKGEGFTTADLPEILQRVADANSLIGRIERVKGKKKA